ncbi:MAG: SRPBCC family protein [Acidobacteria bacterium]|nr:SRPBCC family protein [Acidobacteriota bacterium]MCA1611245.1 SRPBCC family protein [Acidobacteriota bacterium]
MRKRLLFAGVLASLIACSPAGGADLDFSPWFTSRGIDVQISRPASGPPWIRGRGEIPAPVAKVAAVLSDFSRYRELFAPAVKKADVLESDRASARIHFVWPYPFPYTNRDAVVRYQTEELEGGAFRLSWKSDSHPGDRREGTPIEHVSGETRLEPQGSDACRVTYTYLGDLGGKFPAWAQEKAWREEPVQYFRAIRRKLGLPDLSKDEKGSPGRS